ncbi:MAG TPA: dihydrofolate reductase [Steroidobacter sp.]|jgi:dihydrofolate reductase|nr:dihydrofolate reductase [Steroidobacteraceae bacterium]HLS82291.1 dihydrofolate reductase [Steroidobacter sp.]
MSLLCIVVAASENDVIGAGGRLPWRLPDDLRRFKALTMGKPVVMGRKTFESIGRALPGRDNIVISRRGFSAPGAAVVDSIEAALQRAQPSPEIMLIGGAQIYRQALAQADIVHMTRVHATIEGDALFPPLAPGEWRLTSSERRPADERHAHAFTFQKFERIAPAAAGRRASQ